MKAEASLRVEDAGDTAVPALDADTALRLDAIDQVSVQIRDLSLTVKEGVASSLGDKLMFWKKKEAAAGEDATDVEKHAATSATDSTVTTDLANSPANSASADLTSVTRKHILSHISADVPAGSMMAIIGSSGSGKTSLLNVMANRMASSNLHLEGGLAFNGQPDLSRVRNAYVMQNDVLQPSLTCRETLRFAADLRLPASSNLAERRQLVEDIILELGLKECANTLVGDSAHKGLSGGEKRRLSIGIQMLANPSVLFLDEPTTGLDANSAYLLVETCHKLASRGRTIIISIHQPRSDIFFLFDSVTILTRGQAIYSGPVKDVIPYVESIGPTFPHHMNPADFLIDIAAIDTRTADQETSTRARVNDLLKAWVHNQRFEPIAWTDSRAVTPSDGSPKLLKSSTKAPLWREVLVLTHRSFITSWRDPMGYLGLLLECLLMGTICGWIFFKVDGTISGIRSMEALLYTSCAAQGYLILLYETYRLCGPDLKVFDREYNDGCVTPFGYLLSRRLAKCLTEDLYVPLIFSVIIYYMGGLRTDDPKHFLIFFATALLQHYTAVCFAMFCASISREFTTASLVGNLGFTLQSMACGFFVNATAMPVYVRWTKWIAYVYYGFGTMVSNQLNGYVGECPFNINDERCDPYKGDYIIKTLGFPVNWIAEPLGIVLAWALGFYILAYLLLKFLRVSVSVSKSYSRKEQTEEAVPTISASSRMDNDITVSLRDVVLSVIRRKGWKAKSQEIRILQSINATFVPGSINAILGPSGSGKSSLLNYMADRLHSSANQKYIASGEIIFNDTLPLKSLVRSLCSYVTQEDDGLLPSLTVRETLYYAAYLRLPKHLSMSQKRTRANEVILKMGLKECADTLIGGEFVKGISGGEKRRVTISVQLLNDPKILLLDEPTSGLDSFTAASILQVLRSLAEEGRTVICTIHQPRSDLFTQFGNILLLAKGGRVAYNGQPNEMLDHFASLGHPCPELTNPADHVLDLVSVNLQSEGKESVSRMKVTKILDSWAAIVSQQPVQELRTSSLPAEFSSFVREQSDFVSAYTTLLRRSTLNFSRSPNMIMARIMQVVGIGIIFALFFAPLKNDYIGITNRLGLVQEITALYFVGMLNNMAIYPYDRSVFYREHDDNVYGVLPFFLVYLTLEFPFECVTSLIFAVFLAIIPGLPRTPQLFFACSYISLAIVNCGESIGIVFNTLFMHEGFAVNIISVILSIGSMMAGLMSLNMPGFLKALNWLSPLKYGISALINLAFEGQTYSCEGQALTPDGSCEFHTGDQILQVYGLKARIAPNLGGIAVCLVVYRVVAFAVLKINRLKLGVKSFERNQRVHATQ